MTNPGTAYLMSEWEADLNRLLARWPLDGELEDLSREIDEVLEEKLPDSAHAEQLAGRLIVAMSFLAHRKEQPTVEGILVAGSSGSVVKPALARAVPNHYGPAKFAAQYSDRPSSGYRLDGR